MKPSSVKQASKSRIRPRQEYHRYTTMENRIDRIAQPQWYVTPKDGHAIFPDMFHKAAKNMDIHKPNRQTEKPHTPRNAPVATVSTRHATAGPRHTPSPR